MSNLSLLARKVAIAFLMGFLAVFVIGAPSLIDLFQKEDWSNLKVAGWALLIGALAGGLRALLSLLTAFVPSDAQHGVNIVGKYKSGA